MNKALLEKEEITMSITTLEQEIAQLESELQYKTFLYERRNRIEALPASIRCNPNGPRLYRVGLYDYDLLKELPEFETKWKNSFYVKYPEETELAASCSLDPRELKKRMSGICIPIEQNQTGTIVFGRFFCILDAVIPTQDGYIFALTDPFQTVLTEPVRDENYINSAMDVIGQLVIVRLHFYHDRVNPSCKYFEPYGVYPFE